MIFKLDLRSFKVNHLPNTEVKGHLVQKLLCNHTDRQALDRLLYTDH